MNFVEFVRNRLWVHINVNVIGCVLFNERTSVTLRSKAFSFLFVIVWLCIARNTMHCICGLLNFTVNNCSSNMSVHCTALYFWYCSFWSVRNKVAAIIVRGNVSFYWHVVLYFLIHNIITTLEFMTEKKMWCGVVWLLHSAIKNENECYELWNEVHLKMNFKWKPVLLFKKAMTGELSA